MGLTLAYELRLAASTSAAQVDDILDRLNQFGRTLPFDTMTDVGQHPWLAASAAIVAEPSEDDIPPLSGNVASVRGFMVQPGHGCESAIVGFLRRSDELGTHSEWFWSGFCKTQYASTVSEEHFLRCHLALVALLDHAITLGIDVRVWDEGGYWETRNLATLLAEVARSNRMIAVFAGALSDALGEQHQLEAPIFAHPRFEHLEMGEED